MKRLLYISIILFFVTSNLFAQYHHLEIGAGGGASMFILSNPIKGTNLIKGRMGAQGRFDIGYTHYWKIKAVYLGFHSGIEAGYTYSTLRLNLEENYKNVDFIGNTIDYTITASRLTQALQQAYVAVPLMAAFRANNLFVNVGLKMMLPVWNTYKQDIKDLSIDALYTKYSVHVINEMITGEKQKTTIVGNGAVPSFNLLASLEVGYEWELRKGRRFGIGVYLDVAAFSRTLKTLSNQYIVEVAAITNAENPPVAVRINPANLTYEPKMNGLDFGVRIYYALESKNIAILGLHRYKRR